MKLSTRAMYERVSQLEARLTKLALRGKNLVIYDPGDMVEAKNIAAAIFDLSEGRNEVIFDAARLDASDNVVFNLSASTGRGLGRPSVMYNFYVDITSRTDWLSNGNTIFTPPGNFPVHPAFMVSTMTGDGTALSLSSNSYIVKKLQIAKYAAGRSENANYPVSLFGLFPAHTISYDAAVNLCKNAASVIYSGANPYIKQDLNAPNIHMMTASEIGYLCCLSSRLKFEAEGNDSYGKSYMSDEYGRVAMCDGTEESPTRRPGRTACGSGPLRWRHDGSPFGIELRPGVAQWKSGYRTLNSEINIMKNNDAAVPVMDHSLNSTKWQAVLESGSLTTPGTTGTLKWDWGTYPPTGNYASFVLANALAGTNDTSYSYGSLALASITARSGVTVPALLQLLGMMPFSSGNNVRGTVYVNLAPNLVSPVERVAYALGIWDRTSDAGLGCSFGHSSSRSSINSIVGFRSASYEMEKVI